MQQAPLYHELAESPAEGLAFWFRSDDGVRLRAGYWNGGNKGTVILLPGRTEYIEKYGRSAHDLTQMGYATLIIDWRGQGLADRLTDDPMVGHVGRFSDYQRDLIAALKLAQEIGAPEPYFMLAHSMGGCIGLRALHTGQSFKAAVFSAPMWGIKLSPTLRPFAWVSSVLGTAIGLGTRRAPQTSPDPYVLTDPFEDNTLTSDEDMWNYMKRQTQEIAGVGLGGPSLLWLREALIETRALQKMGAAVTPAHTFLGTNERIVATEPIHSILAGWTNGQLSIVDGAEHEVVMERPHIRRDFWAKTDELFSHV